MARENSLLDFPHDFKKIESRVQSENFFFPDRNCIVFRLFSYCKYIDNDFHSKYIYSCYVHYRLEETLNCSRRTKYYRFEKQKSCLRENRDR